MQQEQEARAVTQDASGRFGMYIHVPFCASRCGYCDFNTYTPGELGSRTSPAQYLDALEIELELAAATGSTAPANTVFIGGGTPSLLGAEGLGRVLQAIRNTIGIAPGAEITTESNPESTSPEFFGALRAHGYNRVSLGMQSASQRVLQILDRAHTPGRAFAAVGEAKAAGFEHVNLDIIYGTPTETDAELQLTLDRTLETGVDHVSAYSLIVEDGTAMARKVRKGELPAPDDDVFADRYWMIDAALEAAGMRWYEVSNWALPGGECQHNIGYWQSGQWWGAGPGAHSYVAGQRFYNVKHPAKYAQLLGAAELPVQERETLSPEQQYEESVMLGLRLAQGMPLTVFPTAARDVIKQKVAAGFLEITDAGMVRVTNSGRLLVDGFVADILFAS